MEDCFLQAINLLSLVVSTFLNSRQIGAFKMTRNFTFGLWTVSNPGRTTFGAPTRPVLRPWDVINLLGEVNADNAAAGIAERVYGVNFHDDDVWAVETGQTERDDIEGRCRDALTKHGLEVPMATVNHFTHPGFKDGALSSRSDEVRAYAVQKAMRAMDLGNRFGAKIFVMWPGGEGKSTNTGVDSVQRVKWYREGVNALIAYNQQKGYGYRFAFEAKPNEPMSHILFPTTGDFLAFTTTLDDPSICGVNPEKAHETMAGLSFVDTVARALDMGKLFHIDLNDQLPGRFDQDFRFGAEDWKETFFLVRLLVKSGWANTGMLHFDAHPYRTANRDDVKAFAAGCMASWRIFESRIADVDGDAKLSKLLTGLHYPNPKFSNMVANKDLAGLASTTFDPAALAQLAWHEEAADQRLFEVLFGR